MITSLINDRGNAVANQFVISTKRNTYFQSYKSVVARIDSMGRLILAGDWDYSNTTRKHLYKFFRDNGFSYLKSRKDVLQAIKDKRIRLSKVNSFALSRYDV